MKEPEPAYRKVLMSEVRGVAYFHMLECGHVQRSTLRYDLGSLVPCDMCGPAARVNESKPLEGNET